MEKNLKNKKLGMSFILPESVTQPPQIISVYNQTNPTKWFWKSDVSYLDLSDHMSTMPMLGIKSRSIAQWAASRLVLPVVWDTCQLWILTQTKALGVSLSKKLLS